MTADDAKHEVHAGRVATGLIVLALGALMLFDRHNVFNVATMHLFPGIVLILLGAVRLAWADGARGPRRGGLGSFWLMFIGVWMIVSESHVAGLTYHNSWPLLIIAAGVLIVARELFGPRDDSPAAGSADSQGRR
ncbi:MAG TPA: hypothetical protein VL484_20080 [Vicinamibacterales bacterium]|jgi:hypothetical protein|nr:hypothetical protein [Vicinamibacterales bacterium]